MACTALCPFFPTWSLPVIPGELPDSFEESEVHSSHCTASPNPMLATISPTVHELQRIMFLQGIISP